MSATFLNSDVPAVVGTSAPDVVPAPSGPGPRGKRVLIVDDDPVMRELISRIVMHGGNMPVRASSAAQALELTADKPAALVLTDLNMNGLCGLELLAELSTQTNPPPTLMITSCDDAGALRAARLLGACGIVEKPFSLNTLRRAISAALSGSREATA
jgi:DNA-binding response OmpR family regulator